MLDMSLRKFRRARLDCNSSLLPRLDIAICRITEAPNRLFRGFSGLWYIYTRSEKHYKTARLYTQQEIPKELGELCSSAGVNLIS